MFDDMITDIEAHKNKSYSQWTLLKSKETQHFTCFYISLISGCLKI